MEFPSTSIIRFTWIAQDIRSRCCERFQPRDHYSPNSYCAVRLSQLAGGALRRSKTAKTTRNAGREELLLTLAVLSSSRKAFLVKELGRWRMWLREMLGLHLQRHECLVGSHEPGISKAVSAGQSSSCGGITTQDLCGATPPSTVGLTRRQGRALARMRSLSHGAIIVEGLRQCPRESWNQQEWSEREDRRRYELQTTCIYCALM